MDIQELLLAKAIQDAEAGSTMGEAAKAGALGLGAFGFGYQAIQEPRILEEIKKLEESRKNTPLKGLSTGQKIDELGMRGRAALGNTSNLLHSGRRMATSALLGAVLGGGLGAGTKAMFLSGMPNKAADMLSKIQTSPEGLSDADQLKLRAILQEVYSGQ